MSVAIYNKFFLGITVWSGLSQFLNEREFKEEYREKLKRSHTTMVRLFQVKKILYALWE